MKKARFITIILAAVLSFTVTSCSWWFTTPIDNGRLHDNLDASDTSTDTAPFNEFTDMTGLPDVNSAAMSRLGDNLKFFHSHTEDCVIVYNNEGAWAFDYKLQKVTPLVDYDAMLAAADPIGRSAQYFRDVTLSVECEMNNDKEIRITFTVASKTHEASYSVSAYYTLNEEIVPFKRGDVRGFYQNYDIMYPGYDEPVSITDVADWGKLTGDVYDYTEDWLYSTTKAFVELDISHLETIMSIEKGTLDSWKGAVISDYTIILENPSKAFFDGVTVAFTVSEGSLGLYPAGEYVATISDGPGQFLEIAPAGKSDVDLEPTDAEIFLTEWVSRYGGWYPIESQVVENSGYMHHLIDFYLGIAYERGDEIKYEDFIEFCERTFGFTNVREYVKREDVENHGGHGGTRAICKITSVASSGNSYIFEVTFFADMPQSVIAKVYRVRVTDNGEGDFSFTDVECIHNGELEVCGWSM